MLVRTARQQSPLIKAPIAQNDRGTWYTNSMYMYMLNHAGGSVKKRSAYVVMYHSRSVVRKAGLRLVG